MLKNGLALIGVGYIGLWIFAGFGDLIQSGAIGIGTYIEDRRNG